MQTAHGERIRVGFVAPGCIFDPGSGAAISARTVLEILASDGFDCLSFTASVFDGDKEYPLHRLIGSEAAKPENAGKVAQLSVDGATHQIFTMASTVGAKTTADEQRAFIRASHATMRNFRPHLILSYASSRYGVALFRQLRRLPSRLVLYFLNQGIAEPEIFACSDAVVTPSEAMRAYCLEKFGVAAKVLRDPLAPRNAADPAETLAATAPESRRQGLVTFVNPAPGKGAMLVFALAQMAWRARPDLTFLIVESRVRKAFWEEQGVLRRDLPNIWWVPSQPDMRPVYARTSALLYPSLAFEASGRGVGEAQLGGIPVLGSRRGGIPEQLTGGFLFDVPDHLNGRSPALPTDDIVAPWLEVLGRLMDDEAFYREASRRALEASASQQWQRQQADVVAIFRELAAG